MDWQTLGFKITSAALIAGLLGFVGWLAHHVFGLNWWWTAGWVAVAFLAILLICLLLLIYMLSRADIDIG